MMQIVPGSTGQYIYTKENLMYHPSVPDYIREFVNQNPDCEVRVNYIVPEHSEAIYWNTHSDQSIDLSDWTKGAVSCGCSCTKVEVSN